MSEASITANLGNLTPTPHGLTLQSIGDEQYYRAVKGIPRTMLVQVHSWSGTKAECLASPLLGDINNCVWVCPHFGGQNNYPQAAGHPAQLERIKRVIDRTRLQYPMVERVLFVGASGGMYVSLMFMGAYPGLVYGASLWVGPYDLADWWSQKPQYRESLEACFLGTPAQKPADYLARSPKSVSISGVRLFIHGSPQDTEVPYAQLEACRDRFETTNNLTFISNGNGHVIDYPAAVAELQGMQAA